MRYTAFRIINFKGAREISLRLEGIPHPNIRALVGLNESGKTTILEALHWFFDPSEYRPGDLVPRSEMLSFNGSTCVEAELGLSEDDQKGLAKQLSSKGNKFEFTEPLESVRVSRTYNYANSLLKSQEHKYVFSFTGVSDKMTTGPKVHEEGSDRWEKVRKHINDVLLPEIIYYPNFLFDFPEKIYLELIPKQAAPASSPADSVNPSPATPTSVQGQMTSKKKMYREVIQDVLNSLGMGLSIEDHLMARYKRGKKDDLTGLKHTLISAAAELTKTVFSIWKELLKLEETQGLEITFGDNLLEDDHGYYLEVEVKEGTQVFEIRERSLGFRWFFAFILFTHYRSHRYLRARRALYLMDEPASNLHPSAQSKLLGFFESFPTEQDVIYATHSHHMINPKWLSGTFVVANEAKDFSAVDVGYHARKTKITAQPYFQFAADHPDETDFYRPILDALDYQLSSLEHVPDLVVVEGKNDFYTLKYMSFRLDEYLDLANHIYPSAGKDKTDYIIGLYLGWARDFIVLLDDDSGGRETYKRILREYGPVMDERVFKLSHVDKVKFKSASMEQVFTKPDRMRIIRSAFPDETEYSKSKLNAAIQQALIEEKVLDLDDNTLNRFRSIFAFLKEKMGSIPGA